MSKKIAIVGAGPGGYVAALRAAQLGGDVCLVEKEAVGGTCLNWGCIPSKILWTAADLVARLHQAGRFGIRTPHPVTVDMGQLMAYKTAVLKAQVEGIEKLLQRHGVRVIKGTAAIAGPGRLALRAGAAEVRSLPWDRLILATGTRPLDMPGCAFDGDRILSSDDVLELETLPRSLLVVGGGAIGCEFASMMAALGTEVTLVEALDRLLPLPSVDVDCSRILARQMSRQHIKVLLKQTVQSIAKQNDNIVVKIAPAGPSEDAQQRPTSASVTCQKMLVCVGRRPNTADLGLENIGLAADQGGWLRVDERMETGVPGVSAIGDILGPAKMMLAHVASAEGVVAAENALGLDRAMRYDAVPSAIFTMPEVACVGLTEAQAAERGVSVRTDSVPFRMIGKAQAIGELAGQAKIVSASGTGQVLGVHLIGPQATDLIAEGALAVATDRSVEELANTIHAHPTLAEVMLETALKAADRPRHG